MTATDEKKAVTPEEMRIWMRRYGWADRNGKTYPRAENGDRRCVKDCATDGHKGVCVLGPMHDGECKCVECDK